MEDFKLRSSKNVLIREGKVQKRVLSSIIQEAYLFPGLYAECRILITRREGFYSKKNIVSVQYKELWDCYRNLTGKEDFHPYDKEHPFSLSEAFIQKKIFERENKIKEDFFNLTIKDIILFTEYKKKMELIEEMKEEKLKELENERKNKTSSLEYTL